MALETIPGGHFSGNGRMRAGIRAAMSIEFRLNSDLPKLAWGAVVARGEPRAVVHHGGRVETRTGGFVEGAWNASFDSFPPVKATVVCGSGGTCQGGGLEFWAGTDNVYPIYSIRRSANLFVSNSAIFAMVLAGEEPDPSYPFYYDDFIRIVRLGFNPAGRLRTASSVPLRVHFGHIVGVDSDLNISFRRFPDESRIPDYQSYYRLLADSVQSVLDNAASELRRFPCESLTACSRGYDANACAVLAARAGCRKAITFTGHGPDREREDNGEEIAKALGLTCSTSERTAFQTLEDLAEFCITPRSMSCPYASFESELSGKILTIGSIGGIVWDKERAEIFDDNRASWARYLSHYGLAEYRLRIGLIVFPVPRIGSVHNRDIHRITNSEEMEPWRTGDSYDRPIPRRIVESAGVPRESFGIRKMGSAHVHFDKPVIQATALGERYRVFMRSRAQRATRVRETYWRFRHRWRRRFLKNFSPHDIQYVRYTPLRRAFSLLTNRIPLHEWYYAFSFQYCFEALKRRYGAE